MRAPGACARRCMRAPGALHARGALHAHPHGATTIAVGRCERALEIMVGRFHRALQPRGVDDAPPRAVGRPHAIDPGRCRLAANLIQTSPSSVHTDTGLFVEFFLQTTSTCKNHNMQHVQSTCKNITTSNMYSTVCMLTCKKVDVAPSERSEGDGKGSPLCRLHICV